MEAASVHAPAGLHRVSVPLLRLRSDEQLLALFRRGDEDAFQVIHERYRQRLFAYARQMLGGSRSDAEDAMQDVFLRAYGALRADDRPVSLRAWLYRVAHNRCIDQLRRPLPAAIDLFDLTRGPSLQDPFDAAERREDLRRLVADVRRLPDQQRSALLMREMEGLSYRELSEALVVSIPAVKSLLVRARIGLVEAIEARDAACGDVRVEIAGAFDRGVRASARARRHMRDCVPCREYRTALRSDLRQLNGMGGGHGLVSAAAKLVGVGGAGSGAAASAGGGGAAAVGGSAVATKVAVIASCAAVLGGTVEAQRAATPAPRPASHPTQRAAPSAAPLVISARAEPAAPPPRRARPAAAERKTSAAALSAAPHGTTDATPSDAAPASDSPVVDQASGGMLAPDDAADDSGQTVATPTTPADDATAPPTTPQPTPPAQSGPAGGLTGSTPPTAQGATTPGATRTPS